MIFAKYIILILNYIQSEEIKIKNNILLLEVNIYEEDEIHNEEIKDYPKVFIMSKNIKKGVKKILGDKNIKQDPFTVLKNFFIIIF